ncbi:MAG: hypothetical protein CML06_05665 [Pseudomonadales bacterium]|nr:hypothetical protein [Pseudomonadales bacterium]
MQWALISAPDPRTGAGDPLPGAPLPLATGPSMAATASAVALTQLYGQIDHIALQVSFLLIRAKQYAILYVWTFTIITSRIQRLQAGDAGN